MPGVQVRMHEADRQGVNTFSLQPLELCGDFCLIQGLQDAEDVTGDSLYEETR